MNRTIKTILSLLLIVVIFLLWTGLDSSEYDVTNTVTVEYECDHINEYDKVPKVVIDECLSRSKK